MLGAICRLDAATFGAMISDPTPSTGPLRRGGPKRAEKGRRQVTSAVNCRLARRVWGELSRTAIQTLRRLTEVYGVSVAEGDLSLIDGKWYVTHAGLLRLAARRRCAAISVRPVPEFCDPDIGR